MKDIQGKRKGAKGIHKVLRFTPDQYRPNDGERDHRGGGEKERGLVEAFTRFDLSFTGKTVERRLDRRDRGR